MSKRKGLSRKQRRVIDDIFSGEFSEKEVLEKNKVSRVVFNRWQGDAFFAGEFNRRIASAHRQSNAVIANYASVAATKLIRLTESENPETARKACLDIISVPKKTAESAQQVKEEKADERGESRCTSGQLSDSTASKLLELLAEEKKKQSE